MASLRSFALLDFDHQIDAGAVRAQQLKEIITLTPWMMLGATINCSIIVLHFWSQVGSPALGIWGGLFWLFAIFTISKWHAAKGRPLRPTASRQSVVKAMRHATVLGLLWGALPIIVSGAGSAADQALVTITIVGMSASGAFALAVLPAAAVAHLTVMILPSLAAMALGYAPTSTALAILLINYFIVLAIIILARYREFANRIRDRNRIESQNQTIAVLLKDFEESASDWLWETDGEGRLLYVSDRLAQVSGLDKAALTGQALAVTAGEASLAGEWGRVHDSIRRGRPLRELAVPACLAGRSSWWSLTASPLRDKEGRVTGYRGVGSDITERKAAQALIEERHASLMSFNERLEAQVAERTEEARRSAADAAEASRAKSAFLANMSHEIRTPMNGIFGMADLLSRTELTGRQHRLVTTINQSAHSLLSIINDILDLSRIEAGKLDLDRQEFDLRDCLESAVELLAEDAHTKGLELNVLLPASLPRVVVGDAVRLRQIVVNLIGNAVKFTHRGEISVRATSLGVRHGEQVVQFSVCDTGIGMAPATRDLLFSPFAQGDSSITRRFGGTGLGLSITQNLVHLMNGSVRIESELGKGTTVTFEVVLGQSARAGVEAVASPDIIQGQRVLVVDDRETNREIICSYLSDSGATMETAASGEEALAVLLERAASGQSFSVAILDVKMPGMDGFELARQIKATPGLAGTRLIMVTSLSQTEDGAKSREAGVDVFLTKPIRRTDLTEAVVRSLTDPTTPAPVMRGILPESSTEARLSGLRVLLAEDNPVNQEVAREYLMSLGCEADIVDDGRGAVQAFSSQTFDVVLMDCQMPEMDGLTACRHIRVIERARGSRRVPVIAVTANAYDSDRQACLGAEMDDVLRKPFTEGELAACISRWCNRENVDGGLSAARVG